MPTIIGVKFKNSNKAYYFAPLDIEFAEGDGVIVETVRGMEYGVVSLANTEIAEEELKQPLKNVLRKATKRDDQIFEENERKRPETLRIAEERVSVHGLDMKIVDAEYTFDGKKLLIYFTAGARVDFRDLVKDLASFFHTRIELRQISEREDIKIRGAMAPCGRPCCCTTFLNDFEKVSLKMAKVQNLSLNPTKINGMCGRLMCCLAYENDFYQEQNKKMPPLGSEITTVDGVGTCESCDLLRGCCKVRFAREDGVTEQSYPVDEVTFVAKPREKKPQAQKKKAKNE